MRNAIAVLFILAAIPVHAEPPVIGQATSWNTWPIGRVALGVTAMGMPVQQARATRWEVELDGQPWFTAVADNCIERGAQAVLCEIPHPVLQDIQFVRVRAEGTTEWSNSWQVSMIPCGYFIGQPVFRNSEAVLGWPNQGMVGGACAAPEHPGIPLRPEDLRIREVIHSPVPNINIDRRSELLHTSALRRGRGLKLDLPAV